VKARCFIRCGSLGNRCAGCQFWSLNLVAAICQNCLFDTLVSPGGERLDSAAINADCTRELQSVWGTLPGFVHAARVHTVRSHARAATPRPANAKKRAGPQEQACLEIPVDEKVHEPHAVVALPINPARAPAIPRAGAKIGHLRAVAQWREASLGGQVHTSQERFESTWES